MKLALNSLATHMEGAKPCKTIFKNMYRNLCNQVIHAQKQFRENLYFSILMSFRTFPKLWTGPRWERICQRSPLWSGTSKGEEGFLMSNQISYLQHLYSKLVFCEAEDWEKLQNVDNFPNWECTPQHPPVWQGTRKIHQWRMGNFCWQVTVLVQWSLQGQFYPCSQELNSKSERSLPPSTFFPQASASPCFRAKGKVGLCLHSPKMQNKN